MTSSLSHDVFMGKYYNKAWKIAEITIASVVKKNGPINPAIDVESVKAEGAIAGLERTYENFDVDRNPEPLLNRVVWNCVLTELSKATTAARRAGLIAPKPRAAKYDRIYHSLTPGIKQRQTIDGPVEPHRYMEIEGWQERKEDLLKLIGKYMKKLPVNDQVILNHWAKDEKTYVERSLEELGLENTQINANWVYGRKNKALKALNKMMGGEKPDYHDVSLPSSGVFTNRIVYSQRSDLRRHQYAAKKHVTRNIDYKETARLISEKNPFIQ